MDKVEVFGKLAVGSAPISGADAAIVSLGPQLTSFVKEAGVFSNVSTGAGQSREAHTVLLIAGTDANSSLSPSSRTRSIVENGATAIVFAPGKSIVDLFPNDVASVKNVTGEFADFAPSAGTKLTEGLKPMDIKWWGRQDDWRVFVASTAHRLKPGSTARELIRFIPAHSYIPEERVPEQYMTVLFEIPLGKGRIWVCDLDLEESIAVDPAARALATNLLRAAGDPESTKRLPVVASHKESLKR
jgi:hypothetical protein